jgi:hypothetical protein
MFPGLRNTNDIGDKMKRGFTLVELLIVVVIMIIAIIVASGSIRDKTQAQPQPISVAGSVTTKTQQILKIPIADFDSWIQKNPEIEIVSIATTAEGGHSANPTTHIIIVYRSPAEK